MIWILSVSSWAREKLRKVACVWLVLPPPPPWDRDTPCDQKKGLPVQPTSGSVVEWDECSSDNPFCTKDTHGLFRYIQTSLAFLPFDGLLLRSLGSVFVGLTIHRKRRLRINVLSLLFGSLCPHFPLFIRLDWTHNGMWVTNVSNHELISVKRACIANVAGYMYAHR